MNSTEFEFLCTLIGPQVQPADTLMRPAIPLTDRVAVTLRFLASGDSYVSLHYLSKISTTTIARVVPEVCKAIFNGLKHYIKVSLSLYFQINYVHNLYAYY